MDAIYEFYCVPTKTYQYSTFDIGMLYVILWHIESLKFYCSLEQCWFYDIYVCYCNGNTTAIYFRRNQNQIVLDPNFQ